MDTKKRVHIQIKNPSDLHAPKKAAAGIAKKLGLTGQVFHSDEHIEIIAEGSKDKVWKLISECASKKIKTKCEGILFYFKDFEGNFTSFSLN